MFHLTDEMYAAIDEQDKVYTSGSETYAQIQPTMTEIQRVQNEQTLFSRVPSRSDETYPAPQPPSVDSLRHVAHAHSRQGNNSFHILFYTRIRAFQLFNKYLFTKSRIMILQLHRRVPIVLS